MTFKKGRTPWNKGIPMSKKTKRKMIEAKKLNPTRYWLGKTRSAQTKLKISVKNKGHITSKETRKKLSIIGKGRIHSEETKRKMRKPKSKEHANNISKGRKGIIFSKNHKNKISQIMNTFWSNPEKRAIRLKQIFKGINILPTKPEIKLNNIIINNMFSFKYVGDGQLLIKGFNPDFINEERKLIIEMYGDYWHNKPLVKKKDKKRLNILKKCGYKTLVIWEHELENELKVIDKIRKF